MNERTSQRISVDLNQILRALPQRWPLVLVDQVTEAQAGEWMKGYKNVSFSEPWFQGDAFGEAHLPGTLVLEALGQLAALLAYLSEPFDTSQSFFFLLGVENAKFRRSVHPGDRLDLEVRVKDHKTNVWKLEAEASVEGALAAQCQLVGSVVDKET